MILDLDIGNSRVKWRISLPDGSKSPMRMTTLSDIENLDVTPTNGGIRRVRVSSVRTKGVCEHINQWADVCFGVVPEYAEPSQLIGKVRNGYDDPSRLGVDRWLALIAAFERVKGAVCVMDFGSAMTADALDNAGLHVGGFIAPGMQLMRNSLLSGTDLVRFPLPLGIDDSNPGKTTLACVQSGVLAASVGFATMCWQQFARELGPMRTIVTGGYAESLLPKLEFPAAFEPSLVLDGLALALP